jgi:hypothetical protein
MNSNIINFFIGLYNKLYMKYIDYVNYLKSKNIIMYDHDYRVSYYNINKYYNNDLRMEMRGGGNSLFDDDKLTEILSISLSIRPENLYFLAKH